MPSTDCTGGTPSPDWSERWSRPDSTARYGRLRAPASRCNNEPAPTVRPEKKQAADNAGFTARVSASSTIDETRVFPPKSQNHGPSWESWARRSGERSKYRLNFDTALRYDCCVAGDRLRTVTSSMVPRRRELISAIGKPPVRGVGLWHPP